MRTSSNEYKDGRLIHGYDYDNQAWVINGVYLKCGHAASRNCKCYGRLHEGEASQIKEVNQWGW